MNPWIILAKGIGFGLSVAAPIGPVNLEIIRRGVRSGFREAFALGMGAVTADTVYLLLVLLGISRIKEYPIIYLPLAVAGFALVEWLGAMAIRDGLKMREMPSLATRPPDGRTLLRVYGLGLAMMAVNPLSMGLWLGLSSSVIAAGHENALAYLLLGVAVPIGCASWVVFISTILHFGRRFLNLTFFRAVNLVSGIGLCVLGLHSFIPSARAIWALLGD